MAIGALLTTAIGVAPDIIGAIKGGGGSGGPCPGSPTPEQVDTVRRLATANELAPVVAHWDGRTDVNRKPGQFMTVPATEIIGWLMGGSDCRHGDINGATVQNHFMALVRQYDGAGAMTVQVPPQLTTGAQIQQAVAPIVQGARDYGAGVVTGALSGAGVAAQTGGTAARGASELTQLLPLLLVLALAAWIVFRR